MVLWVLAVFFLFASLRLLSQGFSWASGAGGFSRQVKTVQRVVSVFQEMEDTLLTGLALGEECWKALSRVAEPWRTLALDSLKHLRDSGSALLPTLKRLRVLAEEQRVALIDARAKSAQALAQAVACASLVPLLGGSLYFLLPGVQQAWRCWGLACGWAFLMTIFASTWLFRLAEEARWGGIPFARRVWVLAAHCAGERFLALIRSGVPPDVAWMQSIAFLKQNSPDLSWVWGHSVWESPLEGTGKPAERVIMNAGTSIRKAIHVSLMEGRPCAERVESVLLALRHDMKAQVERELAILSTRALKPLFFCVAPALLGLLTYGLWLAATDIVGMNHEF